jgi:hypothetical protein
VNSIKPLGYNSREAFSFHIKREKTMNNRRTFFIAITFLVTIVACAVPGLPTASAPVAAPTVDAGLLETMVAGTVSAAIAETEQAQPTFTPHRPSTSTPTASSTSTPTPVPTETSTVQASPSQSTPTEKPTVQTSPSQSTPTEKPTAQTSSSLSSLTEQENGSMLFTDERAGYKVSLPAGWLTVRINEKEYRDAFSLQEAVNTNVQQSLLSIKDEDPNAFRLLAIDTQPAHIQNEFVTDMRFVLSERKNISLSSDKDLQAIADKIPASATVFRFEVTSVKIITTANGTRFGIIEAKSSFTSAAGANVIIYQKQVFFNVKAGNQSIILTTVSDLKDTLLPVFDAMLEAISLTAN